MPPVGAMATLEPRPRRPKDRLARAADDAGRTPRSGASEGAAPGELRILVVDDDFLFADVFPMTLQRAIASPRLRIASARTPEEALRLAEAHAPDVVLCDYDLRAATTGLDVLAGLARTRPGALRVLLSGHARRDIPGFSEAPVDAYLEKPMLMGDLVVSLSRLLEERLGVAVQRRERRP